MTRVEEIARKAMGDHAAFLADIVERVAAALESYAQEERDKGINAKRLRWISELLDLDDKNSPVADTRSDAEGRPYRYGLLRGRRSESVALELIRRTEDQGTGAGDPRRRREMTENEQELLESIRVRQLDELRAELQQLQGELASAKATIDLLSDNDAVKALTEGIQEARRGDVIPFDKLDLYERCKIELAESQAARERAEAEFAEAAKQTERFRQACIAAQDQTGLIADQRDSLRLLLQRAGEALEDIIAYCLEKGDSQIGQIACGVLAEIRQATEETKGI